MNLQDRMKLIAARFPLAEAKEKVEGYANTMNEHLAKLYFMPNDSAKNQWYASIWHSVNNMDKVEVRLPSRKRLTANEYFCQIASLDEVKSLQRWHTDLQARYKTVRSKYTVLEYFDLLEPVYEHFYKTLAALLSARVELQQSTVYHLLDVLQAEIQIIIGD